ncbi:MAG: hypothetical protein A2920_01445 [Candidatus Zambryskibacteria bacterium RIFCSPLOWO2_01_FULL_43_17]|uniref:Uncharacterized protein n=1 Tax=Candidatus Zambryskibacteria bacterium RIFCSPLOWO2_01_FULL_43_17 TaxID=1802760 RepID=A0A1G2U509_9BACT|nr:MAG: hypothetical protein A2920_01445 [Candidatus Zambryskibacteria bacterium RIFCSPLOWO2_01_FULL_43_17]
MSDTKTLIELPGMIHSSVRRSVKKLIGPVCARAYDFLPENMAGKSVAGYVCIYGDYSDGGFPRIISLSPIGEVLPTSESFFFADEKAKRLSSHPTHVSSWQSRDKERKRYGGAIRAGALILSFSGLPEWVDEALMVAVAADMNRITEEEIARVTRISENPLLQVVRG